jgi:drug/metabolite transporter (DMT)-like permease
MSRSPAAESALDVTAQRAQPRVWVGWAIALTAVTCFSVATPVARAVLVRGQDPVALLVVRMALATLLLGLTIGLTQPRLLRADRHCFWAASAAGAINSLGMLGYFWGLERLESSMAAMLIACSPIAVLSLLALRGERVTYRHAVRLALALAGVYLLIGPGGEVDLVGVAWISGSLVCFAFQLVILQWYLVGYEARTVTFYVLLAMTAGVSVKWLTEGVGWTTLGRDGWLAALVLAVVSTYVSRLLHFTAIGRIGGGQVAMLSPVETLLTVLWSFLFLDERLSPVQWVGGLLILTSAVLAIQRLSIARLRPRWRLWVKS